MALSQSTIIPEGAEPIWWPSVDIVLRFHQETMSWYGDPPSPCRTDYLDSALCRPQNRHNYEGITDIVELAILLALSIAQSHSFIDGNKRTAFTVLVLFMEGNGYELTIGKNDETSAKYIERAIEKFHESEEEGMKVASRFACYLRSVSRLCL